MRKVRICGAISEVYFIIDFFDNIDGQPVLLILQISEDRVSGRVKVPECFKIFREVTDQPEYSNVVMSRSDYEMIKGDKEGT
jgi:hypothetical protein